MNAPQPCRLLRHAPAPGAWNMAVDEMLLEGAESGAAACLRFYGWDEPTLSLGYFQNHADRREHEPSRSCAAVRRLTGGGAILHDDELTYSIVLPPPHPLAVRRDELYRAMHGCLIETLARFGLAARLATAADKIRSQREPFLCFLRRSPGDVLLGTDKICGSAQRRRNGAVLQHGTLIWRKSAAAPELPGVADLANHPIDLDTLTEQWLGTLGERLGLAWRADRLGEPELRRAETLAARRYAAADWTKNRGRQAGERQETL